GFHQKNWEEREVPVPQKLIVLLKAFRSTNATPDDPVFPSATGRPDGAMLEKLKAVAFRGELNCGHCAVVHKLEDGTSKVNRCVEGAYCGRWFLPSFATLTSREISRTASISGRCSNGWAPRHRLNDGLSGRRSQQRCTGSDQQGEPGSIRVVVFVFKLAARLCMAEWVAV
ncbi:MAG TPA: hypothetical protein VNO32_36040, partial [Candidatus Acidoferrum sp.]|nr:hypothetical protein [Candidatus Acidoferrum sp.]